MFSSNCTKPTAPAMIHHHQALYTRVEECIVGCVRSSISVPVSREVRSTAWSALTNFSLPKITEAATLIACLGRIVRFPIDTLL